MKKQAKILIVDDDPDIVVAISAVLEAHDYQVVTARDGDEGLAKLRDERPELIVLDLLMPKMDGFAVCRELKDPRRAKYANVPILILTSVKEEASRRRYELETGQDMKVLAYLQKPVAPEKLLQVVAKALETVLS